MNKPILKEWLKQNNITYGTFAKKLGITYQAVERIVNNKDTISFERACEVWRATGYEIRFISIYPEYKKMKKYIDKLSHGR